MALFEPSDFPELLGERPAATKVAVGSEGFPLAQGEKQEQITRAGAGAAQADFDIESFDLSQEEYNVPSNTPLENPPDTGGVSTVVIWAISEDDNQFEVEITPQKEQDDGSFVGVGTIDKNVDSRLESESPSGINHFLFEAVAVPSDVNKLTIKNTGTPASNVINGSINFH
ncbi:MAG: hypothetical protein ABEJ72_00165 [Candidatus Aenigmatarchaeota archaeon]